ncbi:MAG: hypothetical protein Fur0022_47810 [Anaerolineales bacterium]
MSLSWGALFIITFVSGGIHSPMFALFFVTGFLSGVILGGRGALSFLGLSLLASIGFVIWEINGRLVPLVDYLSVDVLFIYFAVFWLIFALVSALMSHLREALAQAQYELEVRRNAEVSFKKLEQRYKSIFERTNDAIFLMSFDSTILDVNQRGAEMFGYTREEMIGRLGLEFSAPDERMLGQERLKAVINGEVQPLYERKMVRSNGEEFPVEVNLSLVFDENNLPIQAQSVVRDISERKRTQAKLQDIENRYKALFETHTSGIFFIGLDGIILECNSQAAKMLGYSPDELIGEHINKFVYPEEQANLGERLRALLEGQALPIYERRFICKNGHILPAEVNAMMVYDSQGNPQGIQSIIRDISDRKRTETELHTLISQLEKQSEKIHTALEVSKAAISILEPDILIQKIVELIKERFGYYYVGLFLLSDDGKQVILKAGTGEAGQNMVRSQHAFPVGAGSMVGWSVAHKRPRIALDVGLDAIRFENPFLPETRSEMALPLLIHGEAIGAMTVQSAIEAAFTEEDIAVVQVMSDVVAIAIQNARFHTQLSGYAEELEQRVRERTAQLEATNHELESFSYSVSHDLRTPLRAIHGYASILLEDFADTIPPPARSFQEKIRQNATKLGELVDGLLAFSRLGRKKLLKSEVDPLKLVREVLEELEPDIANRQLEIIVGELPTCEADPLLLKQVFANLLSNAVKFTRGRANARIEVGVKMTERGLAYFVQDNGAGFDMQYVNRLFGVFQRLHRDDEFEGTGVGLAIIQRIIHRHGGNVWVEAELDKGATFYFTLGETAMDEAQLPS